MYVEDGIKMIVYSPPGHGKTTLLGSASNDERLAPVLFVDFESGLRSIKSKVRRVVLPTDPNPAKLPVLGSVKPIKGKVDVVSIKTWEDFTTLYDILTDDHPYKTLAMDSLSELNYLCLGDVLDTAVIKNSTHDEDIPEIKDYLRSSNLMRKLIRYFRNLDMHVIFSSGAKQVEDPKTKLKIWAPALTGQLIFELPGLVDYVGYLAIGESVDGTFRYLMLEPDGKYMAKGRFDGGSPGPGIVNPTLPEFLDLVEGLSIINDDGIITKKGE